MPDSAADTTITVRLVYLARLREAFGSTGEALLLAPVGERVTVNDVLGALTSRGGIWASELAPQRAFRVAVNHMMASRDAEIAPGDEVAIFPPVTGG